MTATQWPDRDTRFHGTHIKQPRAGLNELEAPGKHQHTVDLHITKVATYTP